MFFHLFFQKSHRELCGFSVFSPFDDEELCNKKMNRKELEGRTKKFHIEVLRLCRGLPRDAAGFETGKQLIRAAGSVGANYRASRRAKSDRDFIYKLEVVLEEADESLYWLEVVRGAGLLNGSELDWLIGEASELTAIFVASCNTKKGNIQQTEKKKRPE